MKFGFSLRYVLRPAILSFVLPLLAACAGGGDGEAEPGETLAPTGEPTPHCGDQFRRGGGGLRRWAHVRP